MTELPPGLHGAHRVSELRHQMGDMRVRALLNEGRLVRLSRGVLVDRTRQLDLRTRAAAALLMAGGRAVLTSHTAAVLFGCTAADAGRVHVLVDYDRPLRSTSDVAVHHGTVSEDDVVSLEGLRVFAFECALTELLCRASRETALACVDQALALTAPESRGEFRAEIAHRVAKRKDSRGRRRAEILLDLATGLAESPAESWLLLKLFDAGLPIPAQQVPVADLDGNVRFRLDFAWEEVRVALEYDGFAAHVGRGLRDAVRENELRRLGWTVIRATAADLRDPAELLAAIRQAFWRRVAA
ncbi:endonuclease domain-containing protein [Actinophytocola sp.]|uniref:endonuclease domain-containing protein n=1 Tax=Actinophytocola sp. TaxID=1872138 RepID=UPI002ED5EB47